MKKVFAIFMVAIALLLAGCDKGSVDKIKSITITGDILETSFYVGDELNIFNSNLVVTYESGITREVELTNRMVQGFDSSTAGSHTMKIIYEGFEVNFEYVVENPYLINIRYIGKDLKFYMFEEPNFNAAEVFALYSNGVEERISFENLNFGEIDYDLSKEDKLLEVSYQSVTIEVPYVVEYRKIDFEKIYDCDYNGEKCKCACYINGKDEMMIGIFKYSENNEIVMILETRLTENNKNSYTTNIILNREKTDMLIYLADDVIHIVKM